MFGVDRKPLTDRQADAFDPEQTYCFASDTVRIRNYQLRSAAMLRGYVAPGSHAFRLRYHSLRSNRSQSSVRFLCVVLSLRICITRYRNSTG